MKPRTHAASSIKSSACLRSYREALPTARTRTVDGTVTEHLSTFQCSAGVAESSQVRSARLRSASWRGHVSTAEITKYTSLLLPSCGILHIKCIPTLFRARGPDLGLPVTPGRSECSPERWLAQVISCAPILCQERMQTSLYIQHIIISSDDH